jgi:hypothetical protein
MPRPTELDGTWRPAHVSDGALALVFATGAKSRYGRPFVSDVMAKSRAATGAIE